MYAKCIVRKNTIGKRGLIPLLIEFRYQNQRIEKTITRINGSKWSESKGEVKGNPMLNLRISDIISRFNIAVTQKLNNQEKINVVKIANELLGKTVESVDKTKLVDYLNEHISNSGLSYGTLKTYYALLERIKLYDPEISLDNIDLVWVEKFIKYLKNEGNEPGTIWTRKKVIKTILNKAVKEGIIKSNPAVGVKSKQEPKIPEFLSLEQFKILTKYEPKTDLESLSKDLYCFGVYTGLRFSDIFFLDGSKIQTEDNKGYRLLLKEVKTKNRLSSLLSKPAVNLLEKYGYPKEGIIFPMLNPTPNRDMMNENKQKESWNAKVNASLYNIFDRLGMKKLGFHTSRHSHACISLDLDIPITTISASLGHSKLKMTEHYARVKNRQLDEAANKWSNL